MHRLVIVGVLIALLAAAAPAAAQDSVRDGYGGRAGDVLGEVGTVEENAGGNQPSQASSPSAATPASAPTAAAAPAQLNERTLPFTGADIALLATGGLALLGMGVAMRRAARDRA
jgi:hypothetical protein